MPQAFRSGARYSQTFDFDEEAPPVQNTWYTILERNGYGNVLGVLINQANDETNAKDVQVRITVDGTVIHQVVTRSQANNTLNYWHLMGYDSAGNQPQIWSSTTISAVGLYYSFIWYATSIKVEMRTTSVVGTNQILHGIVYHAEGV